MRLALLLLAASAALVGLAAATTPQPDWHEDIEILDPVKYDKEYRKAQIEYWRTIASLSADETPLSPFIIDQRACPKSIKGRRDYGHECKQDEYGNKGGYYSGGYDDGKGYGYSHYDRLKLDEGGYDGKGKGKGKGKDHGDDGGYKDGDTYLITGSVINASIPLPVHRQCSIPAGKRVILDVVDDFEFYAPPLTSYSLFNPQAPNGVRLTPDSITSFANAVVQVSNINDCLFARINGKPVKDLPKYYHVAFTDDIDLSGGFFSVQTEVYGVSAPGEEKLFKKGFKNTDFASAGWFLIFPKGFPKGDYEIEFGWNKCNLTGGPWWRNGKYYDGKCTCWPNAVSCVGDCSEYSASGEASLSWKYSLHVV